MRTIRATSLAALLASAAAMPTHAAVFCVDTVEELRTALATAQDNGENDTIRIKTGLYQPTTGGVGFAYNSGQNLSLALEGGWVTFLGNACGLRLPDASLTVLSGGNQRRVMQLGGQPGTSGDITVTNLQLSDGVATETGGALTIGASGGFTGDVVIDRVIIRNNFAALFGGGLAGGSDGGTFTLTNSLFLGNECNSNSCAMTLTVNAASPTNVRAFIGGNTIVANACSSTAPPTCTNGGVRYGGSARAAFYNNAFAANPGSELRLDSTIVDVFNNNVEEIVGQQPANSAGNLALSNPLFVDPFGGDFRLQFASPLRNAGTAGFPLGTLDLAGFARLNESQYDIGAYENREILFSDGFENVF